MQNNGRHTGLLIDFPSPNPACIVTSVQGMDAG